MNTPAHVAASLLVWRNEPGWAGAAAVTVGALLPDLPMFGFYAYQKIIGSSEKQIWSEFYFQEDWQLLFDLFNSIPIAIILIAICYFCGFRFGMLLAASALLHMLCDLPLHHDDAHRHFLPLTTWRFESPVSYWDPKRFGQIFMWLELAFSLASCIYVGWWGDQWPMRIVAFGTLAIYFAFIAFAFTVWM